MLGNMRKKNRTNKTNHLASVMLCLAVMVFSPGCRTAGGPNGSSLASVTIDGPHTPGEIQAETIKVFTEEGYGYDSASGGGLTFIRAGNRLDKAMYGSYYEDGVHYKARVTLQALSSEKHRVDCDVVTVRYMGDSFFEEERKLRKVRMGKFQALLNKIKRQLDS